MGAPGTQRLTRAFCPWRLDFSNRHLPLETVSAIVMLPFADYSAPHLARASAAMKNKTANRSAKRSVQGRFRMARYPFHWINRVSARYYLDLEKALKRVQLDVPRWRVLIILSETGPASVSRIAGHAVIKLPTMTKLLQRMEADGLVHLRANAQDARVTEVVLTSRGSSTADAVREEGERVFRRAFAGVDEREIERLVTLLQRVFANLEGHPLS